MRLAVNKNTISAVLYEDTQTLKRQLNAVIDEALTQEEPDIALIDECTELLASLNTGECSPQPAVTCDALLALCHASALKKQIRLRRAAVIALAAAIAASATVFSVPALATQAKNLISSIAYSLGIAADSTEEDGAGVVSLYGEFPEDTAFTVKSEEDIDLSGIRIYAVNKDNTRQAISLDSCRIRKERLEEQKILVTVSYQGCAFSVIYTLEV